MVVLYRCHEMPFLVDYSSTAKTGQSSYEATFYCTLPRLLHSSLGANLGRCSPAEGPYSLHEIRLGFIGQS